MNNLKVLPLREIKDTKKKNKKTNSPELTANTFSIIDCGRNRHGQIGSNIEYVA
tara:strand:+ start:57 stop:218 length:162 start_codon:yes stop_codon:yes gene_type:complete